MRNNTCKQKLAAGGAVIGCAIQQYGSAEIPRALAAAGMDYLFIDLEHGPFGLETVQSLIRTSVQAGITPLVRPAEPLYSLVARVLDIGAQGIVLPRIESPETLVEVMSWLKYPPAGKRGFGIMGPVLDYEPATMPAIIEHLNESILVVSQFESRLALERANELLAVPGIDVAMIGPADLSVSLGVPGDYENPKMVSVIERFILACRSHGVAAGIHCPNAQSAARWIERGMRFAGAGGEHTMLFDKAREEAEIMRAALVRSEG